MSNFADFVCGARHAFTSFCWSAELEEGGTFGPISGGNDNTALAGHVRVVENIGFVSVTMDYLCEGIHPRSQSWGVGRGMGCVEVHAFRKPTCSV